MPGPAVVPGSSSGMRCCPACPGGTTPPPGPVSWIRARLLVVDYVVGIRSSILRVLRACAPASSRPCGLGGPAMGGGGLSGFGGLERTGGGPWCRGGVLARQGDRRDERRGEGDAGGEQESE